MSKQVKGKLGANWKEGTPFSPSSKALQVIPRFPDDQKSVLLCRMQKDNPQDETSVSEFFDYLSLSFVDRTAFFFLCFSTSHQIEEDPEEKQKEEKTKMTGREEENETKTPSGQRQEKSKTDEPKDELLEILLQGTYDTPSNAASSTLTALAALPKDPNSHLQVALTTTTRAPTNSPHGASASSIEKNARPPPNNLQGLVRKKKKTS